MSALQYMTLLVACEAKKLLRRWTLPAAGVSSSVWAPHPTQSKLWDTVVGNTDVHGQSTGQNNNVQDAKYNIFAGKFGGLPPLYVIAGGEEHVDRDLNASTRLAKLAVEAGVHAKLDIVPHMQQCPDWCVGFVPEAMQAVQRATRFINDAMARVACTSAAIS